jgi:hypothetical protein
LCLLGGVCCWGGGGGPDHMTRFLYIYPFVLHSPFNNEQQQYYSLFFYTLRPLVGGRGTLPLSTLTIEDIKCEN